MGKKRTRAVDAQDPTVEKMEVDGESSDDDDFDVVNVDFEWFNFDPQIDFHGVKSLLRQLLDVDSQLFDLSAIADLIVEQKTIGSTVKVDDQANDAYAFLTVLNLAEHAQKKAVADLVQYLVEKCKTTDSLAPIADVLTAKKPVGLVFAERLINMPPEIVPPLYTMLLDEIEAAVEDKEPYEFSHYLIISKTYNEVESTLTEGERRKKKAKDDSLFFFHPEDEVFQKHATAYGGYQFTKEDESVADSKRAFQEMGVKTHGSMILIDASRFPGAVKAVADYLSPQ
jgi:protein BCP1